MGRDNTMHARLVTREYDRSKGPFSLRRKHSSKLAQVERIKGITRINDEMPEVAGLVVCMETRTKPV